MSDQPIPPPPTERDLANAAAREAIAARQKAEYRRVLAWADRAMGPGWLPCGRHYLVEKGEEERARREGMPAIAAATVYSVTNGASKRHFTVSAEGKVQECSGYQDGFGPMLLEPHPTRGFTDKNGFHATQRYSLCWAGYELYEPKTAEQLAALRASRERGKAVRGERKFQQDNPLLAWAQRQQQEEDGPQSGRSGP